MKCSVRIATAVALWSCVIALNAAQTDLNDYSDVAAIAADAVNGTYSLGLG